MPRPFRPPRPVRRRPRAAPLRRGVLARRLAVAESVGEARSVLAPLRRASVLAIALTALLLWLVGAPAEASVSAPLPAASTVAQAPVPPPAEEVRSPRQVAEETEAYAARTLQTAAARLASGLPRMVVALTVLLLAWGVTWAVRHLLHRTFRSWPKGSAVSALVSSVLWLLAAGVALSALVGDVRGLVGSVGLVGLALSWALQTPIESATGWLLNSFRGYYRVGDRIEVGDVFGDVARIDVLTTTMWEVGSAGRPGPVLGEQPTGRLITFPNSVILTSTVINLTRDFPFVWDEVVVHLEKEADVPYARAALTGAARALLGPRMEGPVRAYMERLQRSGLALQEPVLPEVYVALEEGGVLLTVRYLVGARERRGWKTELVEALLSEALRPEHQGRIPLSYPRQQLQFLSADGRVREALPVEARQAG